MRIALAAAMLVSSACAAAAPHGLPQPVLEALGRASIPALAVGAIVEPVDAGTAVVANQAGIAMNPASVMKLVTSFAALDLLGPAFRFHTDFLANAPIEDGVLQGDLVIRGGGDPKLTYERLWQAAHQLRSRGLREIRGDIVIDRAYFASGSFDPGRFDNEPRRGYNVGADAFLVNFGAVQFTFEPGGEGVRVTAEPDLPNVEIASRVRSVPGVCDWWRKDLSYDVQQNGILALASFSGTIPSDCGIRRLTLSVLDPAKYAESVLRWLWSEAGGTLRGKVRAGPTPTDARLIYREDSEPLAVLVRDMNKYSNNVMARQLFLALATEKAGVPGNEAASAELVRAWLAQRRIDAAGLRVENGAGLSRDDRISAQSLAQLLRAVWESPLMPEMASSMPIFAIDGTLKGRPASDAAGHAHLKGGTLTGVQSVAGYVVDRHGKRWILVMIVNHPNANAAQAAIDALVQWTFEGAGR
ncbi:MAG TPA: D-alanyl-D-alanine carboxypeptidase/D-alanyl-D-alanine-endopeptidase [Usitatibacter sp.]|jgi:D-alanyl-D-alanine carboxypeptidase/D-alanyl-D-alanine-endopeptidase (penicillin-binding protein 4)|nr:D-alanyl-D-alanine carboxypeptidase/D-alanyl-D-alanine-endopeptidase [Usitatibacter sp.]